MSHNVFQACIDACIVCGVQCNHCVSECLNEEDLQIMTRCIELDRECSLACFSAAQLMSLGGEFATSFCENCAAICEACAEECEKHDAAHCKRCAEACRICAAECRKMINVHV